MYDIWQADDVTDIKYQIYDIVVLRLSPQIQTTIALTLTWDLS